MARPSKYTPKMVGTLCDAISRGASYKMACRLVGIHFDTFNEWRKAFPEFSDRLAQAEAEAALSRLDRIDEAGQKDWRALAWMLAHRHPEDFGEVTKQVHEHSGPDGQPIPIRFFDASAALAAAAGRSGEDREDT
jgi:hypothetical protein